MTTALRDCTDDTTEARELSRVAYLHIETTTHGASSYHARSTRFTYTVGSVIKIVHLCFDVVPPRVDGQYCAMGDVAISLINITHLRDALALHQKSGQHADPSVNKTFLASF